MTRPQLDYDCGHAQCDSATCRCPVCGATCTAPSTTKACRCREFICGRDQGKRQPAPGVEKCVVSLSRSCDRASFAEKMAPSSGTDEFSAPSGSRTPPRAPDAGLQGGTSRYAFSLVTGTDAFSAPSRASVLRSAALLTEQVRCRVAPLPVGRADKGSGLGRSPAAPWPPTALFGPMIQRT